MWLERAARILEERAGLGRTIFWSTPIEDAISEFARACTCATVLRVHLVEGSDFSYPSSAQRSNLYMSFDFFQS